MPSSFPPFARYLTRRASNLTKVALLDRHTVGFDDIAWHRLWICGQPFGTGSAWGQFAPSWREAAFGLSPQALPSVHNSTGTSDTESKDCSFYLEKAELPDLFLLACSQTHN
jgi:hypothetical protein